MFMDKQAFIQAIIDNTDKIFDEYSKCKVKDIPLPDWEEEQQIHQDWRALPLWWNYKSCKPVQKALPITTSLVAEGPSHMATAWLVLKPHSVTPKHNHPDWGNKIILHLPMNVPEGDVGFWVDSKIHRWKRGELFAFSSSQTHYGFNNTDEVRTMLVMEFDESWLDVLKPYMTVTDL